MVLVKYPRNHCPDQCQEAFPYVFFEEFYSHVLCLSLKSIWVDFSCIWYRISVSFHSFASGFPVSPTPENGSIFLILRAHSESWKRSTPNVLQLSSLFGITNWKNYSKSMATVKCLLSVYTCISHCTNREAGGLLAPTCSGHWSKATWKVSHSNWTFTLQNSTFIKFSNEDFDIS